MMSPALCIRCEEADSAWGRFLCDPCKAALDNPVPPARTPQGIPVTRRIGARPPTQINTCSESR